MLQNKIIIPVEDNLFLRNFELEDAQKIFALVDESREFLQKYASAEQTLNDVEQMIRRACHRHRQDGFGFSTGLWFNETLLGSFSFNRIRWNTKRAEIGFWLGKPYSGKGYASKALRAVLQYGFINLDLNRVEATTAIENLRSIRLLEKAGFQKEGILRQTLSLDGKWADECILGLLKKEWKQSP